jgi:topoisomerase-4 subunit A
MTPSATEPENEEAQELANPQPETTKPVVEATEAPIPEPIKPAKEIGFEITNPDDVDIDDKGQLGLF